MPNSLKARLKKLKYQGVLSQEDIDRIVILPKTEKVIKNATMMTNEEATKHLTAKLECLTRSKGFSEKCDSYNSYEGCYECDLGYKQGNIGEQIESLKLAIIALEQLSKIEDIIEELNHIATEPYDVDDYQEGVTDGIQLAIKTINTKIKERTNSGGNVADKEIEEAIDLLDNLIGAVEDNHNSDYDKAIKMGIEALKRLSNTSNDERRQQYEKPRKIKRIL